MAEISVIVPVYKVEAYLHRCVDSILNQTFENFELILVDDGSPDNCGAICDEYAAKESRIHVIHQKNGGLSAARNAGIDWVFVNSDSQWITFVDSDDWIHPEMLATLYGAVVKKHVNVSVCNFAKTCGETPDVKPEENEIGLCTPEELFSVRQVNAVIACGKLYGRKAFEHIRYPDGKIHEDEFTTYKIIFAEKQIAVTDAKLYFYFQNMAGISKSSWTPKRLDAIQALEEQIQYFSKNGFDVAYKQVLRCYAWKLRTLLQNVEQWDALQEEKEKYINYLKKCQKRAAFKYMRFYLRHDRDIYADAFPGFMHVYSTVKRALFRKTKAENDL